MRTLAERGIVTEAPLELAIWTNEEGSRFLPVMMVPACSPACFRWRRRWARATAKASVADELAAIGYAGGAPVGREVGAYFEAHIEQAWCWRPPTA